MKALWQASEWHVLRSEWTGQPPKTAIMIVGTFTNRPWQKMKTIISWRTHAHVYLPLQQKASEYQSWCAKLLPQYSRLRVRNCADTWSNTELRLRISRTQWTPRWAPRIVSHRRKLGTPGLFSTECCHMCRCSCYTQHKIKQYVSAGRVACWDPRESSVAEVSNATHNSTRIRNVHQHW